MPVVHGADRHYCYSCFSAFSHYIAVVEVKYLKIENYGFYIEMQLIAYATSKCSWGGGCIFG